MTRVRIHLPDRTIEGVIVGSENLDDNDLLPGKGLHYYVDINEPGVTWMCVPADRVEFLSEK